MSFTKLEGHASLFSAKAVNQMQFDITQKYIKANAGNPVIQSKILHVIAQEQFGHKYVHYFIGKNAALRVKGTSNFDLSRLHVAKAKAKAAEVVITSEVAPVESPNKPKQKREAKPKREAKKKVTPIIDETKLIEAPATEECTEIAINDAVIDAPTVEELDAVLANVE